jgi:hypothetical protein
MRDLQGIETTIAEYERDIESRELKARDIDKRIAELEQQFKHDYERLDNEKKSAAAALVTRTEVEAARREVKNRQIDGKLADLQKQHVKDLDRLEHEKQSILG